MRSPIFGEPLGDQAQQATLLVGERGQLVVGGAPPQPVEHPGGHGRVEQRLAPPHPADGVDELVPPHLLEHVAGRPRHDRGVHGVVVRERGQHQAGDVLVARAHGAAHLDAVAVGQLDVEDGHVRLGGRDAAERLGLGAGLADDEHVVFAVQQLTQSPAHDLVIVEEEHPNGHRHVSIKDSSSSVHSQPYLII
jgi:hypothetical protein